MEELGPTAQKLDTIQSLIERMSDNMRGLQLTELEGLTGEQAQPFAQDLMKAITIGMQVLEKWGYEPELPENVVPEAEMEYRRRVRIGN